jgi:hypothetical protein
MKKEQRQATGGPRSSSSSDRDDRPLDPIKEHERYIRSLERARA